MNNNLSHIVCIIDRSGSMHPFIQSTIDGYRGFLDEQKALPGEALFKLVLFNSVVDGYPSVPLQEAQPLTVVTYAPTGSTALFDAMGVTITEVGEALSRMPESERPGKVIFAIITDGEENASQIYRDRKQVADMIEHQQEVYGWQFIFLGANMDAIAEAVAFNIPAANAAVYDASAEGVSQSYTTTNSVVSRMRTTG